MELISTRKFNILSSEQQYQYLLTIKYSGVFLLSNDNALFIINDSDFFYSLKESLGDSDGIWSLLRSLGFEVTTVKIKK